MGGGKAIDTAKIVADRTSLTVIVVPTIASTDAPTSGCAVVYSRDGVFDSVCYQRMNPAVVLVDLGIIAAAPTRFLVAGMGDALSTWFEARSCERTNSANECGGYSTIAGLSIAKLCYETLLSHGVAAKIASERHLVTPALDRIIEANTLLSGVGFESAGLATAHSVHNGLTALVETHAYYHGEKVAFGVLPPITGETQVAFIKEWKKMKDEKGFNTVGIENSPGAICTSLGIGLRLLQGKKLKSDVLIDPSTGKSAPGAYTIWTRPSL